METIQGVRLFDRDTYKPRLTAAGHILVDQARHVLASADRFERVAAGTREGLEPRLALAIDPLVPTAPLVDSLRALRKLYPHLPVTFSTEGLGGALRRLRDRSAALAVCLLLPDVPDDVVAVPLLRVPLQAVVAADHPLAKLERPAEAEDLAPHVQLVLSDPVEPEGAGYGLAGEQLWRFVDLGRRMDFLLAGFGWCRMPQHAVAQEIRAGNLVPLTIARDPTPPGGVPIYTAHLSDTVPGRAGRSLLQDLQARLAIK